MQKKERVRAALRGEEVDRPPAAFWGHDYMREWSAEDLADAMVDQISRYDWDFLKLNPRATYYAEAWGNRYEPSGNDSDGPVTKDYVLKSAADLTKITKVSAREGPFAEQLESLSLLRYPMEDTDIIQTVFSPLAVLGYLANEDTEAVKRWMEDAPADLHTALDAIAETLGDYAANSIRTGASGVFLATTGWGSRNTIDAQRYREFARPYDLKVLDGATRGEFNVVHCCGPFNLLDEMLDYPCDAFHWDTRAEGNAALSAIAGRTGKAVMGGVSQSVLLEGPREDVAAQVYEAIAEMEGKRLFLAPGCTISPQTPRGHLLAARLALVL
jgi:uroporphyrinogen decarboxylase